MIKSISLLCFVILSAWAPLSLGHPFFANDKNWICDTMDPVHGAEAQPATSFKTNFQMSGSTDGSSYKVQIDALKTTRNSQIKGYMIEARDACTGAILPGTWKSAAGNQVLACNDTRGINAVHHIPGRSASTSQVNHEWAPLDGVQVSSIQFTATVVQSKSTYWVKQTASVIPCGGQAAAAAPQQKPAAQQATRPASRPAAGGTRATTANQLRTRGSQATFRQQQKQEQQPQQQQQRVLRSRFSA